MLDRGDAAAASEAALEIGSDVDADGGSEAAAALEALVRAIAANRRELLPFREDFSALAAVVKDPWRAPSVVADDGAAIGLLPKADLVSVRIDPALDLTVESDGPLGKGTLTEAGLVFNRARKRTATVTGPADRLAVLEALVAGHDKLQGSDLGALLLPRDLPGFRAHLDRRAAEVAVLLSSGRALVEAAERLVCRLYAVPAELEDSVVEQALARAAGRDAGA